jgi:cell division protein FtsI (penicillin-binding protein 3)
MKKHQIASLPIQRVRRLRFFLLLPCLWGLGLTARLFSLQVADVETWRRQHLYNQTFSSHRGEILDRWDKTLAKSIPVESLSVRPAEVKEDLRSVASKLSNILKISQKDIFNKLSSKKPFVWIERNLPIVVAQQIAELKIAGLEIEKKQRRAYPYREAAGALLGRVSSEGRGLSGLEQKFDQKLLGSSISASMIKDARGNFIAPSWFSLHSGLNRVESEVPPLRLTIDAEIQAIMAAELEVSIKAYKAKSAYAMMVDAMTGEILGMAQAPSVNLNQEHIRSVDALKNHVVQSTFEPGSTMKPIVAAAALESKKILPDELLDCENGKYRFGGHTIHDKHPMKLVSLREILVRSSNIGMGKIGERMGADDVYTAIKDFGFGEIVDVSLPGGRSGTLRKVSGWAEIDTATHSFGQGVSVTVPQMVRAYAALANGGKLPALHLVREAQEGGSFKRVLSEATAQQVRSMLRGVVEEEDGTGREAFVPGVIVGGKTGTAQKARTDGKVGYDPHKVLTSFVGFADGMSIAVPHTMVLMVVVDEPKTKSNFGSTIAAPVFSNIMQSTFRYLSLRYELHSKEITIKSKPTNVTVSKVKESRI